MSKVGRVNDKDTSARMRINNLLAHLIENINKSIAISFTI